MNTVRLLTCDYQTEAHILMGRLENEGIDCFLTNEISTTLMPQFSNMMGSGVQLMVWEEDLEKAREVLKDKIAPDHSAMICPYCGSSDIGLGLGKNRIIKGFSMLISILMLIPFGYLKPKYYCKSCKMEIE